ncbi:hypothetical protein JS756_30675 [Streptomyces actuosus]|uniref:Uncharacterized protein n=1 Tax=Streptomyces actuosus TaxID=1885 RepID=A0ABS2VZ18_STRAS|nr:hypothetical protein [Streptomyces actuosus]MBN0048392.1 hypothetical protein [Streptomyces actuosus]
MSSASLRQGADTCTVASQERSPQLGTTVSRYRECRSRARPHLTDHIKRFGEYATRELDITPDAYGARLDVDFSVIGDNDKAAAA